MRHLSEHIQEHFEHPKYLYFLISLVLMLILPPVASLIYLGNILLYIMYGLVILIACVFTSKSYRDMAMLGAWGTIVLILFALHENAGFTSLLNPLATLIFFGLIFIRLMQYVFTPKSVTLNDVFALCAGYLVLGVISAPFLFMLDMQLEQAFSISEDNSFYDLLYFSYITLTGVGYGDIVPIHPVAKSMSLIIGITGQLYLAILVGIIVGKYLAPDNIEQFEEDQ